MEAPKSVEEKEAKAPQPTNNPNDNGESTDAADALAVLAKEAEETGDPIENSINPNGKDEDPKEQDVTEPGIRIEKDEPPIEKGADDNTEKSRRGKRIRKSTVNYTVEEKSQKEKKIPLGKGEKLEQMPNVVDNFKAITWSDLDLQNLYSIVFGQGRKKQFKEHLLQFNGVVYPEGKEEAEKDKILAKMYKLKMDDLKAAMDLADVDRSAQRGEKGTPGKEELCSRFLDWLENPKASGKKSGTKKGKRKRAGSSEKRSTKKSRSSHASTGKKTPPVKKDIPQIEKSVTKSAPKTTKAKTPRQVQFDIPGVDIEKVREKVKSIVENAEKADLTVKGVRKLLEDWLDTDLTNHKDIIRSLVMDVI